MLGDSEIRQRVHGLVERREEFRKNLREIHLEAERAGDAELSRAETVTFLKRLSLATLQQGIVLGKLSALYEVLGFAKEEVVQMCVDEYWLGTTDKISDWKDPEV